MPRYAVFLRGINVNGIKVPMADLRACLADAGFPGAKTILQTGNVVLDGSDPPDVLRKKLERSIGRRFGYDAYVIPLPMDDLTPIVDAYPFANESDDVQPYVMFVSDPMVLDELLALGPTLDPAVERIRKGDGVIYWEVRRSMTLHSAFGKASGRKRFQATTTTRNLRTLRKMLE